MDPQKVSFVAESWGAVLGLTAFIDGDPVAPSISASRRVIKIEDELKGIVRAFLKGNRLETSPPQGLNYESLSAALLEDLDPERLITTGEFPVEITSGLIQVISAGRQYCLDKLPRSNKRTPFGLEAQRPGENQIRAFRVLWSAVDDPLESLKELTWGSLTSDIVDAIKQVYPSLYGRLVEIVIEEIATMKATKSKVAFSRQQEKQLQTLLGTRSVDARVGAAIQKIYAATHEKEEPRQPGGSSIKVGTSPSAGQRLSAGVAE